MVSSRFARSVTAAGVAALAVSADGSGGAGASATAEQTSSSRQAGRDEPRHVLSGRSGRIGATVGDLPDSDAGRLKVGGGAVVRDVTPGGPASKAGVRTGDIVVEFDGERVRSARQLNRLVHESVPERTLPIKVVRDGKRHDLSIAPTEARTDWGGVGIDDLRDRFTDLPELPPLVDLPGMVHGPRLGVTVNALTPQLATYFGAKDGVLVASVEDNSPAARAGVKAGDVITAINGGRVSSRGDVVTSLRRAGAGTVTLSIVRDHKDSTVSVQVDDERARRRAMRQGRVI